MLASLEEDSLIGAARRATGLDDLGDGCFREPLRLLLACFEEEASLTPFGRMGVRQGLIRLLSNRLLIEHEFAEHPETSEQAISRPIYIIGLPRTGTTLLYSLLACDRAHRPLRLWEAMEPAPERRTDGKDLRVERARRRLRAFDYLAPKARALHETEAEAPEECVPLFQNALMSLQFEALHDLPSYGRWLEAQDMGPAYQYYRRQLQILQRRRPGGRWLLKSPAHLSGLDHLFRMFPETSVVQLHRDPLKVMPSVCSLIGVLRGIGSDQVDPLELGRQWPPKWALALERATGARERVGSERFFDVQYTVLLADPLAVVRGIYDRFGLVLEAETEGSMHAWLAANKQHKYGVHRYTLEQFGMDAATEQRRFADYMERFAVAREND